jgi:hypothetical protein
VKLLLEVEMTHFMINFFYEAKILISDLKKGQELAKIIPKLFKMLESENHGKFYISKEKISRTNHGISGQIIIIIIC